MTNTAYSGFDTNFRLNLLLFLINLTNFCTLIYAGINTLHWYLFILCLLYKIVISPLSFIFRILLLYLFIYLVSRFPYFDLFITSNCSR